MYPQICPVSSEKPNFCDESTANQSSFFFFLSFFPFFSRDFQRLVRKSGLSKRHIRDNFVHEIIFSVMDNSSIKQNIRNKRKARKYTQEEMAYKMGMSLTAYRDLEKGDTSIVNTNLLKLAELLKTTSEELVLGYRPSQMEGPGVEDIREEYTGRVTVLEQRVADLEKLVQSLEETIFTKNEIITMLKKSLGGEK